MKNAGEPRALLLLTVWPLAIAVGGPASAQVSSTPAPATTKAPASAATTAAPSRSSGAATAATANTGESVIVTGTRSLGRKARDSTSPIDVVTAATLRRAGQPNIFFFIVRSYT